MIRITDQYFWNFVFGVFFLILVIMGVIILETETRIPFTQLTVIDYLLVTLASWRVTRLFVSDTITKFLREQFWDVEKAGRGYQLVKPKVGPRRTLADLFSCQWCFGLWSAAMVIFFYLITEYAIFPVMFLAVSAAATFMYNLSLVLGMKAETSEFLE